MKKILGIVAATFLFAAPVKNDKWFVGFGIGQTHISSFANRYELKIGYYFYDPNIYRIDNRIYLNSSYTAGRNLFMNSLNLDWLKRNLSILTPFVGMNIGYLTAKTADNVTFFYGFNAGLNIYVNAQVDFDMFASYKIPDNSYNNGKQIKELSLGVNFNF